MTQYFVDEQGRYLGGFDGAEPPAGAIEVPYAPLDARMTWDGEQFSSPELPPPVPAVPQQVAMWQARTILIEDDLLDDVNSALAAIPDEKARKLAQAKFEYSSTVRRDDPLVTQVIPKLGKTEADIDEMFARAAVL